MDSHLSIHPRQLHAVAAPKSAPLVWINELPGIGKLTIARILTTLVPTMILIDDHKLIDPRKAHVEVVS